MISGQRVRLTQAVLRGLTYYHSLGEFTITHTYKKFMNGHEKTSMCYSERGIVGKFGGTSHRAFCKGFLEW